MIRSDIEGYPILAANDLYVVRALPFGSDWMEGSIQGYDLDPEEQLERQSALARAALDSMSIVQPSELAAATCTDGRWRLRLDDGGPVPVRLPLVGSNAVTGLRVAEALSPGFYPDPSVPFADRAQYTVDFMADNGQTVTTHEACGASKAFATVLSKEVEFAADPEYQRHVAISMPEGMFGIQQHLEAAVRIGGRLYRREYESYAAGYVTLAVRSQERPGLVEYYNNDGRGVDGHLEKARLVIDEDIADAAVSPNKVIDITGGDQVFTTSNAKAHELAQVFSNGGDDAAAYIAARHAIASFAAAGHGALGSNLPPWYMSLAS